MYIASAAVSSHHITSKTSASASADGAPVRLAALLPPPAPTPANAGAAARPPGSSRSSGAEAQRAAARLAGRGGGAAGGGAAGATAAPKIEAQRLEVVRTGSGPPAHPHTRRIRGREERDLGGHNSAGVRGTGVVRPNKLQHRRPSDDFNLRSREDHQIARAYVVAARDLVPLSESVWVFPHLWTPSGLGTALLYQIGVIDEPLPPEEAPGFVLKNLFRIAFQCVLAASSTQHYNFLMSDVATCLEYAGEHREPHLACKIFVDVGAGRAFTSVWVFPHLWTWRNRQEAEKHIRAEPDLATGLGTALLSSTQHYKRAFTVAHPSCGASSPRCPTSPRTSAGLGGALPEHGNAVRLAEHDFLVADGRCLPYRSRSSHCVFDKGPPRPPPPAPPRASGAG
eukprot:tig00000789_g4118.t1